MKFRLWPHRRWLRVVLVGLAVLAVLLCPYVFSRVASPWRRVSLHARAGGEVEELPVAQLRVACYNIAHGRGLARSNWEGGGREERMTRLDRIADLLRRIDADVVVLNEVDFDCTWSNSVNQARHLAEKCGYPYRAEERNLDFRFLAWKWRFGNAILSRYPIANAEVVDLPGYSAWETVLAGKKRSILCDVRAGDRTVRVIGAHLSDRSESVRVRSAAALVNCATTSPWPTIVAGDMNSTPPGFPESATDPRGDNAIEIFDNSERFQRSPMHPPVAVGDLTFHSAEPGSIIDWVLIPPDWRFLQYGVESSQLSDHRPVYADVDSRGSGRQ